MLNGLLYRSAAFALAFFLLEGGGSILHALVLRDIPAELLAEGVNLSWMLKRDLALTVFSCAAFTGFFVTAAHSAHEAPLVRVASLGVAFALGLEALNWVLPNALFDPTSVQVAVVAWGYFILGSWLAANISCRRRRKIA